MNQMLKGKKLLILGAYRSEIDIIEEAKKQGIYTIVTDNHTDWTEAPAKYEADEAWNISWSDMETLRAKCIERGVDGCMAGFSERRVGCAQELCRIMGFPFYTDGADLETIFNKRKFKDACRKCGINVPKDYKFGDKIDYPVIVKPADNGGSRGITICYNDVDLETAYTKALKMSDSGEVVIEEYITGDEAVIYYYIQNGNAVLVAMCDRYVYKSEETVVQLPTAYIFPSHYTTTTINQIDDKVKRLLKNIGVKNGVMFLQAFVRNSVPIIYEPGYRLNGARENCILSSVNGINSIEMLIRYSLLGYMSDENIQKMSDPFLHGKYACKLSPVIGEGKITSIQGFEEAKSLSGVVALIPNNVTGDVVSKTDIGTLVQIAYRAYIVGDSLDELKATVKHVSEIIQYYKKGDIPMIQGSVTGSEFERYGNNTTPKVIGGGVF